ncbi:MAG: GDP-mannose 4,6-dehydratase [Acidobacteria bacterium]|nr:GDP-mannose 4,6-dehydratase [Acidobacteriota bacterium]
MKILVTGGAGFIGSHLSQRLLARGDQLAVVDNLNAFYDPALKRANLEAIRLTGSFQFHQVDILDRGALEEVFRKVKPEKIVHLAARAGVRPSLEDPALYAETNVTGTTYLLELARRSRVENFVFGSSSSVYGLSSSIPFQERDPVEKPISPYAVTKRAGELMCTSYHHNYGLNACCLRFFTVYGPRQRPDMAIHKFARLITRGEAVPLYAQGAYQRDYTYISDIIEGVVAALDANLPFEILNLGSSHPVQSTELVQLLEKVLQKPARVQELPAQTGDVPVTYADVSRARALLNYQPKVALEEGITHFVAWFQRQPRAASV